MKGILWGAVTETGPVRAKNEDSFCVNPEMGLFAVADGMGGHRAGEIASRLALEVLEKELVKNAGGQEVDAAFAAAVQEANKRVWAEAQANPDRRGMGTTLSACLLREGRLFLAHVGDSRIYRLRGGVIEQLTEDHSLVQELAKQGKLEQENPQTSPLRNVLTRALGTEENIAVDFRIRSLRPGDRLVLCTDGLTNLVSDDEIVETVAKMGDDPSSAAHELVAKAVARGGTDNITLIVVVIAE